MIVRPETPSDGPIIRDVVHAAFLGHPHHPPGSEPIEPAIVEALRAADALALSLVAEDDAGDVIGHIAFSRVLVEGIDRGWYGLAPIAVRPDRQGKGVGAALMREGLGRLQALGAAGVVLVGEPGYYGRFGFHEDARLTYADVPPAYFLCLPFGASVPAGTVTYHAAFSA